MLAVLEGSSVDSSAKVKQCSISVGDTVAVSGTLIKGSDGGLCFQGGNGAADIGDKTVELMVGIPLASTDFNV